MAKEKAEKEEAGKTRETAAVNELAEEKNGNMATKRAEQESVYTVEELIANYHVFATYQEIVAVALKLAGTKVLTLRKAKEIVRDFQNKK